jgi:hypothetical protein
LVGAKYNTTTGIDELNSNSKIKLYPNPANNLVNFSVMGATVSSISVEIYDILGAKVAVYQDLSVDSGKATISISDFDVLGKAV